MGTTSRTDEAHRVLGRVVSATAAAVMAAVGLVGLSAPAGAATSDECFLWAGEGPLQSAIDQHACVQLAAGTWIIDSPVFLMPGKVLRGDPAVPRASIRLEAGPGWVNTQGDAVVNEMPGATGPPQATVSHFLVDANGRATGGIGARNLDIQDMTVQEAKCWGIAAAGYHMTINASYIRNNGADPTCPGAPGAGIYAPTVEVDGWPGEYAPVITNNFIRTNTGPGLDIAGVWGGTLSGNTIEANSSWAGISILASRWTVTDNLVVHPATNEGQPYKGTCRGGPAGVHSAAIFLCQTRDASHDVTVENTISDNRVISWYGILLIGNDGTKPYYAPRNNTLASNDAFGSLHAFADDFKPGQWLDDKNHWSPGKPTYF